MGTEQVDRADVQRKIDANSLEGAAAVVADVAPVGSTSDQPVRGSALTVGASDDPYEAEADRVADQVMRALQTTLPATAQSAEGAAPTQRVQRSTRTAAGQRSAPTKYRVQRSAIGADGGVLDDATSDRINQRRGSGAPLEGRVRRRMEDGFGADLGNVRVHSGAEATDLSESMQAAAFTVGNDVFLHGASPSLSTPQGERLLAHEIAHTFQQTGTGQRQVRRKLMSTEAFNAATYEGRFTGSSKAQKSIRVMLDAYHARYPWESQMTMTASDASTAIERLEEIRRVANLWIQDHEVDVSGTTTRDPKREKRRAGMDQLIAACEGEMRVMRDLMQYKSTGGVAGADQDIGTVAITQESEQFSKIKEKYSGDALSGFRRLGFLIDGAVPVVGDKAAISMTITIPIPPGFISLEFSAESGRDTIGKKVDASGNPIPATGDQSRVESALTVGVSGGASVGSIAKLSAGIGCFLKAKAKTGADVAELMSYALFRRCRESAIVPREITNAMWGGGRSGDFGWVKAETWSKGVETRIFADDEDAEVSSGAYGKLAAEVEVSKDLASLGFEVKGTKGTKINKESIESAKGSTGAVNKNSGKGIGQGSNKGSDITTGGGDRGTTQASLGVKNLGLETSASFAVGILSGGLKAEFGWSLTGTDATGKPQYQYDTFKVSANLAGKMPFNKTAGDAIAALVPNLVGTINKLIRGSTQAAQAETRARTGGAIAAEVGSYAAAIAELASVPKETWQPFAASPATAGVDIGSTVSLELSGSFDFKASPQALAIELRLGQSSAVANAIKAGGDVVQVFKLDITKSSRLLKLTYAGGKWEPS